SVPAVYVQLWVVRIVPARVRVPLGLLMTRGGMSPPAVVAVPVNVCAPAPLTSSVAVPPVAVEVSLMLPCAARVPVPLRAPVVRDVAALTVTVVPAAIEVVARRSTLARGWEGVIVPTATTRWSVPRSRTP